MVKDPNRPPVWQMIREAVEALGGRTSNVAMMKWVLKHYPGTKVVTIRTQIIVSTVNHPSRIYYPQNQRPRMADRPQDFLFRTSRGRLELYDPARHGRWAIAETGDGKLVPAKVEGAVSSPGRRPCRQRTSKAERRGHRGKGGVAISASAVDALRGAYRRFRSHELVEWRVELCLSPRLGKPTRADVWRGMALALCTSQQKSGPGTRVYDLWEANPCPVSLKRVQVWRPRIAKKVAIFLRDWGGVRFYNRIGKYIQGNYEALYEDGLGENLDELVTRLWELHQLPAAWDQDARRIERVVCAAVLELDLYGIGNKQCRNWLQAVGLLRYEVPLDSRVVKFLEPFTLREGIDYLRLGDSSYYHVVEDAVQDVSRRAGLLPCIGDAVMFLCAGEI